MVQKKATKNSKPILVPIKFTMPDNVITRFATNMTVQVLENEFKISFFEQSPPLRIGPNPQIPDEIEAICVSSVIVTAAKLPSFINALQDQLDKFNTRKRPIKTTP